MFWYSSYFSQKPCFFKTDYCPFKNESKQDFADFLELCRNLKAKIKKEDVGILKKGKTIKISYNLLFKLFYVQIKLVFGFGFVEYLDDV